MPMQAQAKGAKIINEDGLMSLIKAAPAPAEAGPSNADDSDDEIAFVSTSVATASKTSKLGAELNRVPASSKRPQQLASNTGGHYPHHVCLAFQSKSKNTC